MKFEKSEQRSADFFRHKVAGRRSVDTLT